MDCNFNVQKCEKFVYQQFQKSVLPSLMKFIQIPNLSRNYDKNWDVNGLLTQAANHLKDWVTGLGIEGLTSQIIQDQGYSPLLFTEVKGTLPITYFFYGHYDKQPPFVGWNEGLGPTTPVIKDGKLYGRGGADDGYATYGTLLAIKALQDQNLSLPRCVMITEGDQQSGSGHMDHYLPSLSKKIGDPSIFFCLDSGTLDYDRLWLTNSLRGNLVATLRVQVMTTSIHSGDSSGIVPSCFRIARQLLNRVENSQTGEINSNFQVNIPSNRYEENYKLAKQKNEQAVKQFPLIQGVKTISNDSLTCLLNRAWKPTLTIIGQKGLPEAYGAGNAMQPYIELRFSLRLPPTLQKEKALKKITQLLTTNVPYNAQAELKNLRAANGWNASRYDDRLNQAICQASLHYYKKQRLCLGEGGSIPLMGILSKLWPKGQFLITGVLGPYSNAHGPNEFLHLDYTKKLICSMAYIVAKTSQNV